MPYGNNHRTSDRRSVRQIDGNRLFDQRPHFPAVRLISQGHERVLAETVNKDPLTRMLKEEGVVTAVIHRSPLELRVRQKLQQDALHVLHPGSHPFKVSLHPTFACAPDPSQRITWPLWLI